MRSSVIGVLVLVVVAGLTLLLIRGGGSSDTIEAAPVTRYCESLRPSLEREFAQIKRDNGVVQFRTGQRGTLLLISLGRAFAMCVSSRGGESALADKFLDAAMDLGEAQIVGNNDKGIEMLQRMIGLTRQMEQLH